MFLLLLVVFAGGGGWGGRNPDLVIYLCKTNLRKYKVKNTLSDGLDNILIVQRLV